ncbi:hypothetical protein AcV5_002920 [Taiwanofungus camphoratus]|nr:hypothetical protein AcV5_002920 [Antrodia cinnamomea]
MEETDELRPRPRRYWYSIEPTVARLKSHTTYYAGDSIMNASTRWRAREHVGDEIYRGLPVHEFVRAIWGFGPEDIPAFKQYTLPIRYVNMYLQRHVGIEDDSSLPLAKILEHLLTQINSGERPQAQQRHTTRVGQRLQPTFLFRLRERSAKGDYTETEGGFSMGHCERQRTATLAMVPLFYRGPAEQEEAYYEQDRPSYFEDSHQRVGFLGICV